MTRQPRIRRINVNLTAAQYLALDALATRQERSLQWTVGRLIELAAKEARS